MEKHNLSSADSVVNGLAADRIKRDIIHKAKIKREYAKVRERELAQQSNLHYQNVYESRDNSAEYQEPPSSLKRHPERENMINEKSLPTKIIGSGPYHADDLPSGTDYKLRQKPLPFRNEVLQAERLRAEAHVRQKARKEAELQKMQRWQERERIRRAMAKARGTRNGKRKLGGESKILLEKVKKIV